MFLMPTKPLVTQQHEACQTTCGIPSADAATITGDDPDGWRDTAVSASMAKMMVGVSTDTRCGRAVEHTAGVLCYSPDFSN